MLLNIISDVENPGIDASKNKGAHFTISFNIGLLSVIKMILIVCFIAVLMIFQFDLTLADVIPMLLVIPMVLLAILI